MARDQILLFRHDLESKNILQRLLSDDTIREGELIEAVLAGSVSIAGTNIRPHVLFVHSYRTPAFCNCCGEMLWGLVRQGLKCDGCGLDYHKRCALNIPNNCKRRSLHSETNITSINPPRSPTIQDETTRPLLGPGQRTPSFSGRPLWMDEQEVTRVKVPHTFQIHSYTRPTICQHCKHLLKGLFRQGMQCRDCKFNCHKRCIALVPNDCLGESALSNGEQGLNPDIADSLPEGDARCSEGHDSGSNPPEGTARIPDSESHSPTDWGAEQSSETISPRSSNNIPLMRVVQSLRHAKRKCSTVLVEGWLMHYSKIDSLRKRHYWRLDSKCITLYQNETGTKFYKEIPLSQILLVKSAKEFCSLSPGAAPHSFEVITDSDTLYVGENLHVSAEALSSGLSGGLRGSGVAQAWEQAIRQALMPVVPQSPQGSRTRSSRDQDSSHQPQKNTDISVVYQIFPDDVLGSGQFGVVYGGKHRKTGRDVAIKVIDKLRFESKQESQLRNEVSILQVSPEQNTTADRPSLCPD
ncbi:serine/threonine-protein kinase D3-like [Scyliorhinus torazame]|uniref:serine/threonine-protein kinase D3-like n=1 Tax=Scyliorhinus torazame TaxID=75743 RepID=UPI003B59C46B